MRFAVTAAAVCALAAAAHAQAVDEEKGAPSAPSTDPNPTPPVPDVIEADELATESPFEEPVAAPPDEPAVDQEVVDEAARKAALTARLDAELATIELPLGWQRVEDERIVWRTPAGVFVAVAATPADCRDLAGLPDRLHHTYYLVPGMMPDRATYCLQRVEGSVLVTVGNVANVVITPMTINAADYLMSAIRDRLRPVVNVPVLGVSFRPLLAIVPTEDGFTVHGLPTAARVTLVAVPGACGALPRVYDGMELAPLRGARWSGRPRLDGDTAVYCFERRDDVVEVRVDDGFTDSYRMLDPAMRGVLDALHGAASHQSDAPRLYGDDHHAVALPHTGVMLRDTLDLDAGWQLQTTPSLRFKLVDGAPWGEPDTDLLLPTMPYRYAIGFKKSTCRHSTEPLPPRADALFPLELGALSVQDTGAMLRAEVCADGTRGRFAVIVRALPADGVDESPGIARDVVIGFARSAGVVVPGREFRTEGLVLVTAPIVWSDAGASWGLAARVRSRKVWGRPYGFVALVDLAVGLAGNEYEPGPEPVDPGESGEGGSSVLDAIGEARLAMGATASAGDFTLDAMAGAAWQGFWPDGDWLEASIGLGMHIGRNRLQARYTRTLLRPAHSAEVVLAVPPVALYAKATRFPTEEPRYTELGRPRLGLEFGAGFAF